MPLTVCRHSLARSSDFSGAAIEVMAHARYEQRAPLEDAPEKVDCLTLIYYLFDRAVGVKLPLTHIGNMVGQLRASHGWTVLSVNPEELLNGDLIFAEKLIDTVFLTHGAIFLQFGETKRILHTTKLFRRPVFHTISAFKNFYHQSLSTEKAILYVDHRDPERKEKGTLDEELQAIFRSKPIEDQESYNGPKPPPSPDELLSPRSTPSRPGSTPSRPGSTPPGVRIRSPTPGPVWSPSPPPPGTLRTFSSGQQSMQKPGPQQKDQPARGTLLKLNGNSVRVATLARSMSDNCPSTRPPGKNDV